MAYENLKNAIKQAIKQNGNKEITGDIMQSTLLSIADNIYEIVQTTGEARDKVMSQKATSTELNKKADKAYTDAELNKKADKTYTDVELNKKADKEETNRLLAEKANTADVNSKFTEEKKRVDDELAKKFDKVSVVQESGYAEDKVMSQKAVTDNLTELQNTVFPLEVYLSIDKRLLEYTGSEQSIKATYSIKRKGSPITPTALALSVDGSLVSIDVKQADTVTIKVNKEGETQIILTANHGDLVKSASSKVTMVLPIYYGFGTTETDIAIAANKLSPRLSAIGTYAKTSAKDDVNFIIIVPKTLPRLTSFTMGGAPFVMETSSVTINGKDYYMYKSCAIYMTGTTLNVQAN